MRFMMLMIPKGYEKAAAGEMPNAKAVAAMICAASACLPPRHLNNTTPATERSH